MAERADVIVVGAGPAGLSAAGALARIGCDAVVLERDERIGARWERRYDRLHLHTVRSFSGLAHYAIPRASGRYPSKDAFAAYLREYAEALGLDVRTGVAVERITPCCGGWRVQTSDGEWFARAVVLATGRYDEPIVPEWAGRDEYRGRLLHSADYRSASDFADVSVLVIGIGNSGAEIAGELAEDGAAAVTVAVRTPPPITPRDVFGIPIHLFGIALARFPAEAVDRLGAAMRRIRVGDLRRYGLGSAEWGPFTAQRPPVIDVGFLRQLKAGRIAVRPAVVRLTEDGAVFADGTSARFDAVIAATGFRSTVGDLLDPELIGRARGLYTIGFRDSIRGALFEINRDSRKLAVDISTQFARPERLLG